MNKSAAQIILANLVNYVLKREDNPCSAQTHFDHAIYSLSEMCYDRTNWDNEVIAVVNDSREHMAFYHEEAKKPWPQTCESPPLN